MSFLALAWFYFWIFLHPGQGLPFPGPGTPAFTGTPVSYEASAHTHLSTAGTSASFSITLGGTSSTRAVLVGLTFYQNTASGITVTVGGNSASLISGTDTGNTYSRRSMLYGLPTSLTGAQTVAISWTTNEYGAFGAISATAVNQSTPFANGTFAGSNSSASSASLTITSGGGDLTSTVLCATPGTLTPSSNQAEKWSDEESPTGIIGAGDVGIGTGTATHTWTASFTGYALSGASFCHN